MWPNPPKLRVGLTQISLFGDAEIAAEIAIHGTQGSVAPNAPLPEGEAAAAKAAKRAQAAAEREARRVAAWQRWGRAPDTTYLSGDPLCVSYGLGVDSTAMLVGLHKHGIRPDLITFADTGNEKPETYAYLPHIQAWLAAVGFPPVVVVKYEPKRFKHEAYSTLEGNCISNRTLPSLAFGGKGCSLKWKTAPQNAHREKRWPLGQAAIKRGEGIVVAIGYDCSPADSRRSTLVNDEIYRYWYPLRTWGWLREQCKAEIAAVGLPVPMKSACTFCPATKPHELTWLTNTHPDLADRIIAMERDAKVDTPGNGLWRGGCKGTRGGIARSGRMTDWIERVRAGDPSTDVSAPQDNEADELEFQGALFGGGDDDDDLDVAANPCGWHNQPWR